MAAPFRSTLERERAATGGGNLSVHCHPVAKDMTEVFAWSYPQHETYYVMIGGEDSVVYLGRRADVSLEKFHECA